MCHRPTDKTELRIWRAFRRMSRRARSRRPAPPTRLTTPAGARRAPRGRPPARSPLSEEDSEPAVYAIVRDAPAVLSLESSRRLARMLARVLVAQALREEAEGCIA